MTRLASTPQHHGGAGNRRVLATMAVAAVILLLTTGLAGQMFSRPPALAAAIPAPELARVQMITQGAQADIVERGDDAAEQNRLIPVAGVSGGAVAPFRVIDPGSAAYGLALKCLTQAIYYEAANEPVDGQRAVAQVVLNRVRHPAYPDSVCGVVYQGWNQSTCQFTFVCDGSLLRPPLPSKWREAEEIAADALAGDTEQAVGAATSYHADYVLPRWAFSLPKVGQLGTHIFYQLPGRWGTAQALSATWNGREAIPQIDMDGLRARLVADRQATEPAPVEVVPGLTVTPLASDRHAPQDVGGRIDTTKAWRLTIPLPVNVHPAAPVEASTAGNDPLQGNRV